MKKNEKIFCICMVILTMYKSSYCQHSPAYLKALSYITQQNGEKSILVSDTLINLPFANFGEEIGALWKKNNRDVSEILYSADSALKNKVNILNELKNLKFDGHEPTYIVYFSNFYSNMVIGEILERHNKKHGLNHDSQTAFNSSIQYLFVFDEKYLIKNVYKGRVQYE